MHLDLGVIGGNNYSDALLQTDKKEAFWPLIAKEQRSD